MRSLQYSLFLDYSSTVCTIGISLIVKLLPFFAAYAREDLKNMLPTLLAILARLMCWKERPPVKDRDTEIDVEFERELENEANRVFSISPHIKWERLEMTFNLNPHPPSPSSRPLFTVLYYLYPANLLMFLRTPVKYLITNAVDSPYKEPWEQTLDQDQIRSTSEVRIFKIYCWTPLIFTLSFQRTYYGNIIAILCLFGVLPQRKYQSLNSGENTILRGLSARL